MVPLNNNVQNWVIGGVVVIFMYWFYCYKYWALRKVSVLSTNYSFLPMIVPHVYAGIFYLPSRLNTVKCYEEMKKQGLRFAGLVTCTVPVLIVADLNDIGDIYRDVECFEDRGFFRSDRYFPLDESKCTFLDGRRWREMSDKLTPDNTSDRIKFLFQTIAEKRSFLIDIFDKRITNKQLIDIREVLSCFTANIIMSHTYGISCSNAIFGRHLLRLFFNTGPNATKEEVSEYLYYKLRRAMAYREINELGKINFFEIHSFMTNWIKNSGSATNHSSYLYQMVTNHSLFFQECFDTSCTTTNFAIYELCRNADIQDKVRQEINKVLEKHSGEFTLDSLGEMTYLSQVIDETLRMYPPAANMVKFVYRKNYTLGDNDLTLKPNTGVIIPLYALHRDADYNPEPEKFDPDRFNKSVANCRSPALFMPFGGGLVDCKSIHATLLLSKISLVTILRQFKLSISPRTLLPLQVDPKTYLKPTKTLYIAAEYI